MKFLFFFVTYEVFVLLCVSSADACLARCPELTCAMRACRGQVYMYNAAMSGLIFVLFLLAVQRFL